MEEEHSENIRSTFIPKWMLYVFSIVSVLLIVIPAALYFLSASSDVSLDAIDYGITIDASSSKTKFTLYDWKSIKENGTGVVNEKASEKLNIQIGKFANNLTNLVGTLRTTIEKVSGEINETRPSFHVPIYLGATAGMLLLNAVNDEDSDKIFKEIRTALENYAAERKRFKVENVEIISGEKEGLYAWIATNYLMDYVPPRNRPNNNTVGVLEMGGASSQIAFQTLYTTEEATNLVANEEVKLFDIVYDVYTYSNLCFGNDESRRRYQLAAIMDQLERRISNEIDDPCTHPGQLDRAISKEQMLVDVCTNSGVARDNLKYDTYVFKARPDIDRCQELTRRLVNATYVEEYFGGHQIPFKTMDESPPVDMSFYALATYYFAMSQIEHDGTLRFDDEDELRGAIDRYCARSWDNLIGEANASDKQPQFLHNYCFSMNYIFMYLKHVHKFSGKQFGNIEFRQKLDRGDLSWTLGYMLQATNFMSIEEPPLLSQSVFIILLVVGLIIGLSTVALFFVSKRKLYRTDNNYLDSIGQIEIGLSRR